MTDQLENSMIRELSDDELLVVSGAKPMESEASRYTPDRADINLFGLTIQINWKTGRWAVWRYGAKAPGATG